MLATQCGAMRPMVSWGTSPEMGVPIDGRVPGSGRERMLRPVFVARLSLISDRQYQYRIDVGDISVESNVPA